MANDKRDVVADYRAHSRRSLADTERRIRLHLLPAFGPWNAASVTDADVRAYQQRRLAALKPLLDAAKITGWPRRGLVKWTAQRGDNGELHWTRGPQRPRCCRAL